MARTDDIAHFRIRLAENNQPLGTELLENETTLFDTAQKHPTMIENDEGGSFLCGKARFPGTLLFLAFHRRLCQLGLRGCSQYRSPGGFRL